MSSESKQPSVYREWLKNAALPSFVIQLALSTLGAIFAAVLVVLLLSVLFPPSSMLLSEPYFIAPILAGFFLGWLGARFFRSSATVLVWIVPAAALFVSMGSEPSTNVWDTYFGKNCGASECAGEWLFTQPLYTSVAYTVGWVTHFVVRKRRESRMSESA